MSATLETPAAETPAAESAASRLQAVAAAVRLSFTWFGTRKTLTADQKAEAAEPFGADMPFLSAAKKLIDTKHPLYRAVTAVRHQAIAYWKNESLPYPEPGVRLVKRERIAVFDERMNSFRRELAVAAEQLDEHFESLKSTARDRLGRLFTASDYPATLVGLFELSWDFPNVQPPDYLQRLNPELYREECRRVQSRFDEALRLAEEAFAQELSRLVGHLTERLAGEEDGRPKIFRDSAVGNLLEFFDRFRALNVHGNEQLDALVAQCRRIIGGIEPRELRESTSLREHIAARLGSVESALDSLLVDRPRRRIVRAPR